MKHIMLLLGLTAICSMVMFGQHLDSLQLKSVKAATASWDSISVSAKSILKEVNVYIYNYGPDTLLIARKADTSGNAPIRVRKGWSYTDNAWPLGYLRIRAKGVSTNTASYDLIIGGGVLKNELSEGATKLFRSYTGTASQDTLKLLGSYKANLDSAGVKRLIRVSVNNPVASDSIFIWEATNVSGARYFAKIIVPSTAPPPFFLEFDVKVDSGYVIIKRYKTSDVTVVYW